MGHGKSGGRQSEAQCFLRHGIGAEASCLPEWVILMTNALMNENHLKVAL